MLDEIIDFSQGDNLKFWRLWSEIGSNCIVVTSCDLKSLLVHHTKVQIQIQRLGNGFNSNERERENEQSEMR